MAPQIYLCKCMLLGFFTVPEIFYKFETLKQIYVCEQLDACKVPVFNKTSFRQDGVPLQANTDIEQLKEQAKIFGRGNTTKCLTNWQKEINKEAAKIAEKSPLYLTNRGKLII